MADYGSIDFNYVLNDMQSKYNDVDIMIIKYAMLEAVNMYKEEHEKISQEEYFAMAPHEDPKLGSLRGYMTFSKKDVEKFLQKHINNVNMNEQDIQMS